MNVAYFWNVVGWIIFNFQFIISNLKINFEEMTELSLAKAKTATVAEMINRFRNAPPTSTAVREAMRQNGDAPCRMWYENINTNDKEEVFKFSSMYNDDYYEETNEACSEIVEKLPKCVQKLNVQGDIKGNNWRQRYKLGLKDKVLVVDT